MTKFIFILIAAFSTTAYAQENFGITSVRAGIVAPANLVNLKGQSGPDTQYYTAPTTAFALGVNMGPLIIGFEAESNSADKTKYGETDSSSVGLRMHGESHSFDLNYRAYQGLYIENSKEINPALTTDNKIQRVDLKIDHFRFDYMYTMTPENFNLGIFDQSYVPSASGGSFLFGATAARFGFSGNPTIAPINQVATYGDVGTLKEVALTSARVGAGGAYIIELSRFYISGMAYLSAGPQWQTLDEAATNETKTVLSTEVQAKASVGYNADHFFTALNGEGVTSKQEVRSGSIQVTNVAFSAWVGWRF